MSEKICKAIEIRTAVAGEGGSFDMVEFAPENPELVGGSITIHPDEDGVQWYWTPDDAPTLDTSSPSQR